MWPRRLGVLLFGRPASASTGPGHPDLFGIARGRFLALEIKKARAKPQPIQEQRLRELRECGAYAWIVRTEEQACYAVYWTVKGWTRPLSNEPLDLSDWLLGEDAKPAPAAEFAPNAIEPMPFEPGGGRAADPEDTFKIPVPPQPEAPLFETEIEIEGPAPEGANLDLRDYAKIEQQERDAIHAEDAALDFEADKNLMVEATQKMAEWAKKVDADVRTVGERVTLLHEQVAVYTSVLHSIHDMMSRLMGMITEDEAPGDDGTVAVEVVADNTPQPVPIAPRQRRSRKKTSEPVVEPEPPAESSANGSDLSKALEEIFPSS